MFFFSHPTCFAVMMPFTQTISIHTYNPMVGKKCQNFFKHTNENEKFIVQYNNGGRAHKYTEDSITSR